MNEKSVLLMNDNKKDIPVAKSDEYWMKFALEEANIAFEKDEVPIGAVVVYKDKVIARDHNSTQKMNSSLAHAEKLVIESAQRKMGNWLYGCKLYVTLEPCLMCSGAIILSRIDSVIYGASDEKSGTCGSIYNVLNDTRFNHSPIIKGGVLANESSHLLKKFFQSKRDNK